MIAAIEYCHAFPVTVMERINHYLQQFFSGKQINPLHNLGCCKAIAFRNICFAVESHGRWLEIEGNLLRNYKFRFLISPDYKS